MNAGQCQALSSIYMQREKSNQAVTQEFTYSKHSTRLVSSCAKLHLGGNAAPKSYKTGVKWGWGAISSFQQTPAPISPPFSSVPGAEAQTWAQRTALGRFPNTFWTLEPFCHPIFHSTKHGPWEEKPAICTTAFLPSLPSLHWDPGSEIGRCT